MKNVASEKELWKNPEKKLQFLVIQEENNDFSSSNVSYLRVFLPFGNKF